MVSQTNFELLERKKRRLTHIPWKVRRTPTKFSEKQLARTRIGNQTKTAHTDGIRVTIFEYKKNSRNDSLYIRPIFLIVCTLKKYRPITVKWVTSRSFGAHNYCIMPFIPERRFSYNNLHFILFPCGIVEHETSKTRFDVSPRSLFRRFIRIVVDTTEPTRNRRQCSLRHIWPFETFINKFLLSSESLILASVLQSYLFVE